MKSGSLVALCLAALLWAVLVPWSLAIKYRRHRTPKTPTKPKKVLENANNYRFYREYTALILCWALVIVIYIAVLDRAVNDSGFMGAQGSRSRNARFQVLAFVRTALAVVHLPLMTTVLASTVPYWTMAKFDRRSFPGTNIPPPSAALDESTRVTKLFYLADKSWSGLIGWITTSIYGYKEGGLSHTWAMLALVAALSYIGFPLLSLAYVPISTQYWESGSMPATVRLGGLNSSFESLLEMMQNPDLWMNSQDMFNSTLDYNLTGFNSSNREKTPFGGIQNQTSYFPWADNQTIVTLSPNTADNKQMPLAGIRAFASCGIQSHSFPGNSKDSATILNLELDPASDGSSALMWRCGYNCSNTGNLTVSTCSTQSSIIDLTQFDFINQSDVSNVGPTFQGQTLSCIQQEHDDLQSFATILLASSSSNASTQVARCNVSVTYVRPMVNTLIGSYIDSTASSTTDIILNATPVELLNLSMASFIDFFHQGPPPLTYQEPDSAPIYPNTLFPIFTGFDWIYSWKPPREFGSSGDFAVFNSVSSFDERVFLGPLASLINDPSFFQNGTVAGVQFKTAQGLAYGKVPAVLAVVILGIPVLCTIALSTIATIQRRWTASLDAFSMFKLGSDWQSNIENQKLISLGKVSSHVKEIPGSVLVNPETGFVGLAHPPKKRKLERGERRLGWLQEYTAVDYSVPQGQRVLDEQQPLQKGQNLAKLGVESCS